MSVKIRFLGTGNAFADGGRSHACIHLEATGASLLLDCGGSSLPAIKKAMDPATVQAIAISHLHGDHFGGVPYFLMEQYFAGRKAPLAIGGPRELQQRATRAGEALYKDFFGKITIDYGLSFITLKETPVSLGGAEVSALPVKHVAESDPHGLRVKIDGKLIAYSGDARFSDELVDLAKGADLFICESTNYAKSDSAHLSYKELLANRAKLDCGRMILTHLGAETQSHIAELEIEAAQDGMLITL
ncbi:MAG TPA: MBL fold metallo-hydrolase [Candidatus Limnocylindria bacterium]